MWGDESSSAINSKGRIFSARQGRSPLVYRRFGIRLSHLCATDFPVEVCRRWSVLVVLRFEYVENLSGTQFKFKRGSINYAYTFQYDSVEFVTNGARLPYQ